MAIEKHDQALLALGRGDSLRISYARACGRFVAFLDRGTTAPTLADLTPDNARAWVAHLRATPTTDARNGHVRPKGPTAIWHHVQSLKALAHFLVAESILPSDPLAALRLPKVPQLLKLPFTADEIRALLSRLELRPLATRNRAILYLMLATGVRASELVTLKLDGLDLRAGTARVWGKGSKERQVQFDRSTAKYIGFYLAERGTNSCREVFLGRRGVPMTRSSLLQMVHDLGEDAGVADCHPHRFRHSFSAFYLQAHPGALFHLQSLLGHSDLGMVRRYSRSVDSRSVLPGPGVIEILGLGR